MKKAVITAVAVTLALCLAVGGTLAYLVATSGPVTNTFTVGDINITLAETTGANYKIIPGGTEAKDPVVTVEKGSEKCWVYVSVENNLILNETTVVTPNIQTADWNVVVTKGNKVLYRYKEVVDAASANVPLSVFTQVAYADTILKDNIDALSGKTIVLNAFAHQSANIEQSVADAAAKTQFGF